MYQTILHAGQPIGQLDIQPTHGGYRLQVQCDLQTDAIVRLCADCPAGQVVPFAVLEPTGAGLACTRTFTQGWLAEHGMQTLPTRFYLQGLADCPPPTPPRDAVLEAILHAHPNRGTPTAQGFSFPFVVGQETPFACCLTACTLQKNTATLVIPPQSG